MLFGGLLFLVVFFLGLVLVFDSDVFGLERSIREEPSRIAPTVQPMFDPA